MPYLFFSICTEGFTYPLKYVDWMDRHKMCTDIHGSQMQYSYNIGESLTFHVEQPFGSHLWF